MGEFSEDSTNSNPKLSPSDKVSLKQKQKLNSNSLSSCGLVLDKKRLHTILENVPSAVVVTEKPDGRVIYANKRAIELHGVNPCGLEIDLHPSKLRILTTDGRVYSVEKLPTYRALVYGETTRNKPIIIERPDGKRFIVNVSANPLYDKEGSINAAVAIFDDVTEYTKIQEALKESEERLNMAQRIAKLGSWEYYVEEDKAIWSEELFRIFSLKPQQYGPNINSYINLIHPEDRGKVQQVQQLNRKIGEIASYDYRIILSDGSVRTIHSESVIREVDRQGAPKKVMGIEQDITERKQIEEKLERYSADLEKLVEERTNQLKNAERLAAIGQVAGMVGHDIRNPLQAIASELYFARQAMAKAAKGKDVQDALESINVIQQQADYISKIVSDLQDYAKPLKPELGDINICQLIFETLKTINIPKNVQTATICEEDVPQLKLDSTFMRRILTNLVTNAIQAMPDGGKLTVKAVKKENKAAITVEDTGVGIPDDAKAKLFTPLFTTKDKGQGFGLPVVKRLVEAQGGTITFESQIGKGTIFTIDLSTQKS